MCLYSVCIVYQTKRGGKITTVDQCADSIKNESNVDDVVKCCRIMYSYVFTSSIRFINTRIFYLFLHLFSFFKCNIFHLTKKKKKIIISFLRNRKEEKINDS